MGQLMSMLQHPVVKRSQLLTDRLLRLLGLVSIGLPEINANNVAQSAPTLHQESQGIENEAEQEQPLTSFTHETPVSIQTGTLHTQNEAPRTQDGPLTSTINSTTTVMSTGQPQSDIFRNLTGDNHVYIKTVYFCKFSSCTVDRKMFTDCFFIIIVLLDKYRPSTAR